MAEKILLADDEAGIRKVLGISLADSGYVVLTAANGQQALEIFRQQNPSIVLTDIKMPGIDGIELLKTIKAEKPDTEVIMISGHADLDLAIKSLKLEATDFITKPINDDVLEIALKRAHDKISLRTQLKQHTENLEKLVKEKSARLIEMERLAAVGQAVEGFSAAMASLAGDVDEGITYFNELPCFVSIHNRDLKVIAANQLYKKRLGDKVGGNSWEIYAGKRNTRRCPVADTFHSGKGQRCRETIRYRDGKTFPVIVHTAPIRDHKGALELVLEISADITEVKRLQEELQATRQQYQQLFNEVPCYISVQNSDLRITAVNRRFKEDFGDVIGARCHEVLKQRADACPGCIVAQTFKDGRARQAEMIVRARSGERFNVLSWTAPLRDALGNITHVMEMLTNVTEIRRLQDHLASLGLMVGSISHGIKGVLTGLDAGLYLLETGLAQQDSGRVEEGLEVAKMMADRIRNVVLNILYYAKERDLNWEKVPVARFVDDLLTVVSHQIDTSSIELVCESGSSPGDFEIDRALLQPAIVNILENAVEACMADTAKKTHRIVFCTEQDAENIRFSIRDNGVGMTAAAQKKMFTLFFSSKGAAGTGLGLFIARQNIERHGGFIEFSSTLGVGSKFSVNLRRQLPQSSKRHPPA